MPLLAHAASHVGDPQVRHRGTIGGSLAHADPASDLPATMLALGGSTSWPRGPDGERVIAAADFFTRASWSRRWPPTSCSPRSGCPKMRRRRLVFQKFNRRAQDWAIVGVAAWRATATAAWRW